MNNQNLYSKLNYKNINELWETQVEKTPEAVALIFEDQRLTYQELNSHANQLAHYLQTMGVGQQTPVGLCIPCSLKAVVGLLAIFKLGAIYIPLDPFEPQERLKFMLDNAQISVVITLQSFLDKLTSLCQEIICLDSQWPNILNCDHSNLETPIFSEQIAYIIYTSGTTGKPKGVITEHSNLSNYIRATAEHFQFNSEDIITSVNRLVFGSSLFELLAPLISGATVFIFSREQVLNTRNLVANLEQVNNTHTTPSLMQIIINFIKEKGLEVRKYDQIKRVLIGGDRIPPKLLEEIKITFRQAQIHILYGCSEVTSLCSSYQVNRDKKMGKILIGQPFNNMELRLCDENQKLVSVGEKGEIYVGGKGVTRGYWHREDLTKVKYIEIEGQRFYKTGDIGRYDPDGNIEFIGRADNQIKIRGNRIELGEIESILEQHPLVKNNVVNAYEDSQGEKYLVAYIVSEPLRKVTVRELRTFLQEKLPDYMIPSYFLFLDNLPLNSNGKIDRKALPKTEEIQPELSPIYVEPRDRLETRLKNMWQEVLGMDKIGVEDNFFEMGGDSFKAMLFTNKLEEELEEVIYIVSLLESPTIAEFALHLREKYSSALQKYYS